MHKTLENFIVHLSGILCLSFAFCFSSTPYAAETTKPPQRIVSLLPSLTETVCALGACNRLVGVDRYSNWPESIAYLPRMGGGIDPNIESIVALKPDLVLMAGSARGVERLRALGLTVLTLEPKNYADVENALGVIAKVTGVPSKESDRVWRDMNAQVEEISKSLPQYAKAQRVYFEVSPVPFGASESSFIGETLQRLGATNILPAAMGVFPQVSPEFVVRAQPDIIMVGDSNLADMQARPAWMNLQAMKAGRVCTFKPNESDVLVRPGPRMVEAARLMSKCLVDKSVPKVKPDP
jgi:iron complex transport system substrate-binding protein